MKEKNVIETTTRDYHTVSKFVIFGLLFIVSQLPSLMAKYGVEVENDVISL